MPLGAEIVAAGISPTQAAIWEERFKRAAEMKRSGATEIKRFMGIFDLQLHTLRTQQPRPELQGLVDKIKESISKARVYLTRARPYGIAEAQWTSLRENMGHAEEVVERYEAAIEQLRQLEQQQSEVIELERTAGTGPISAFLRAPPVFHAVPMAQAATATPTPAPEALTADGTAPATRPAPGFEPEPAPPARFPTGLVVGGAVTLAAIVGGSMFLLRRRRAKTKGK